MAKKSKIARNEQRKEIVARHAERRSELKRLIKSPHTGEAERASAGVAARPRQNSRRRMHSSLVWRAA